TEHIELDQYRTHRARTPSARMQTAFLGGQDETADGQDLNASTLREDRLNRRTLLKLDLILLPFLSLLFLLNSLDRSNIGNAETANFTQDIGLDPQDLNTGVACFFAVFVALQPVGAALGRKYGMARWVPACMMLWGICTALHIWIRKRWQLITLRIMLGCLEAGFYPTTVSYISLFYTRFEFARRLGMFYGQVAVAGALGGLLSYAVFSYFPTTPATPHVLRAMQILRGEWRPWEVLFVFEGLLTMVVAVVGFFWLPHSADTAWFLSGAEREWAEDRIRRDRNSTLTRHHHHRRKASQASAIEDEDPASPSHEESNRLLEAYPHLQQPPSRMMRHASATSITADTGLSKSAIISAITDWHVWYLLVCNILSAIPAMAFSVFLPLVVKGLGFASIRANLLTAPPFIAGAIVLWTFTWWSDHRKERILPILYGLVILLAGLTATVMLPRDAFIWRYLALCVLLGGSFVASPLTVAWLTDNTPDPAKRSILLGINGWGNLSGVFSALLFAPAFEPDYVVPFYATLGCVMVSFVGYMGFRSLLVWENERAKGRSGTGGDGGQVYGL
ncbi:hypothetical protein LTR66_013987, partial [Elasticomyces elasticus]